MSHKYVLLKEVCEKASSNIAQKDLAECDGIYPIYGASGYIKSVDFFQQAKDYIAIVKDGAGIGRAMKLPAKSSVIGTMQYILPNDKINISYLYYAICSMHLEKYFSGATIPHIYFRDYQNEQLPLPTLEEQAKIANVFGRIDYFIKKEKEQLINLDKLVKSRFIEMFGDPITNDKELPVEPLGKHIELLGGFAFKSTGFTKEGIPVLRIGNINSGYFKSDNLPFWKYDKALDRYLLYPGDLAISLTGTVGKDDYGNICRLGNDYPRYYLNQRNAKLILKDTVLPEFIRTLLKNKKVKDKIVNTGVGIRQANISNKSILELEVPIPNLAGQNQFAAFVTQVDKSKFVVTAKFQ